MTWTDYELVRMVNDTEFGLLAYVCVPPKEGAQGGVREFCAAHTSR